MVKSKIIKILPFWMIGLIVITGIQIAVPLISAHPHSFQITDGQAGVPEVLAASTLLRGETKAGLPELKIKNLADVGDIKAKSFIVFDLETGENFLERNTAERLQIASLTKLMTALVAYQNSDLNQSFVIGPKDTLNISPLLGLKSGDSIKALDIFNSMIVGSCNDAAVALANFVSKTTGQNFVGLMNSLAKELGMAHTRFSNPAGFDSQNNYSTADDLKLLISATQKFSAFNDLGRRSGYQFTSGNGNIYNTVATNKLIQSHGDILAIKTGYTNEAHGSMAIELMLNGHRVVILVLDSQNREGDTLKLKLVLEKSVIE